jgi:hypothetical protein
VYPITDIIITTIATVVARYNLRRAQRLVDAFNLDTSISDKHRTEAYINLQARRDDLAFWQLERGRQFV